MDIYYDMVLFDLFGIMGSDGVIVVISVFDYLFVLIKVDCFVLESMLNFVIIINDWLIKIGVFVLKGFYLFWNMVDCRECMILYDVY